MKKAIISLSFFLFACVVFTQAQRASAPVTELSSKLSDGKNVVKMPGTQGSFEFNKRGDKFSDVVYKDANGRSIKLVPKPGGTNGLPESPCKYPLPDACFGSTGAEGVAMCFCRPTDVKTAGGGDQTYMVRAVIFARKAGDDKRMDY